MSKGIIRQQATISHVTDTELTLDVCRAEACASCHAKGACGGGESRQLHLLNDGQGYTPGEQVTLVMQQSMGLKAVLIAYLIPVIMMISALLIMQSCGVAEITSGLITLLILGIYLLMIRIFRGRISREISIEIEKVTEP